MSNREYLNTLSNEKFAVEIFCKVSEMQMNNIEKNPDLFEIVLTEMTVDMQLEFEKWLNEEHKE